jgi:hypothetical protein
MLGIVLLLMISILPQRRKKYLLKRGQKIITDFMGIEINGSLAVNGRHPYTLSSQWLDPNTNKIYIFKSENIWFNPENYITNKKIEVLIDPKNYDKYYMNISFLPEGG